MFKTCLRKNVIVIFMIALTSVRHVLEMRPNHTQTHSVIYEIHNGGFSLGFLSCHWLLVAVFEDPFSSFQIGSQLCNTFSCNKLICWIGVVAIIDFIKQVGYLPRHTSKLNTLIVAGAANSVFFLGSYIIMIPISSMQFHKKSTGEHLQFFQFYHVVLRGISVPWKFSGIRSPIGTFCISLLSS